MAESGPQPQEPIIWILRQVGGHARVMHKPGGRRYVQFRGEQLFRLLRGQTDLKITAVRAERFNEQFGAARFGWFRQEILHRHRLVQEAHAGFHSPAAPAFRLAQETFVQRVESARGVLSAEGLPRVFSGVASQPCALVGMVVEVLDRLLVLAFAMHDQSGGIVLNQLLHSAVREDYGRDTGVHHFLQVQFSRSVRALAQRITIDVKCFDDGLDVVDIATEIESIRCAQIAGVSLQLLQIPRAADNEARLGNLNGSAHRHIARVHLEGIHRPDVADVEAGMWPQLDSVKALEVGRIDNHGDAFLAFGGREIAEAESPRARHPDTRVSGGRPVAPARSYQACRCND